MCLFWPAAVDLRKRNVRILTTMMMIKTTTMTTTVTMMTMTITITMTMTMMPRVCVYRAWGSG